MKNLLIRIFLQNFQLNSDLNYSGDLDLCSNYFGYSYKNNGGVSTVNLKKTSLSRAISISVIEPLTTFNKKKSCASKIINNRLFHTNLFSKKTERNVKLKFRRSKTFLSSIFICAVYLTLILLLCRWNVEVCAFSLFENKFPLSKNWTNDFVHNQIEESEVGSSEHFTHTWAVHIPNGDNGVADQVARKYGFINMGKIFDEYYHFAHQKVSKRSLQPAHEHQFYLTEDDRVRWAQQQKVKSRKKRDFIVMRPSGTSPRSLSKALSMDFDDQKWVQMWYLNRGDGLDMNVIPAWKEGITGKGIVVTILDDGLESNHPDLEQNYDKKASYDVNSHDDDPMPHYDLTDSNRHGTRCAGEVAATANNSFCAVGIAFGARVGGVRMLDGDVTDAVEARSLSLNPQHIDIYSASWGPDDDGKTVDGPGELASRAFLEGVTKGRGGKGSIFIWASGNGGREHDNCNCDGYTNSIWTLSISSATQEGRVPWYSEKCSSTLATTYSSGDQSEKQVVTTDLHHSCTDSHTGTSASAPLAAGIAALVLESNSNLTWRDLQHIVVRTANPANLKDSSWATNGVGRRISHSFGYGLMDAAAMVKMARTWKTVPEQQRCEINAPHVDIVIQPKGYITLQLSVKHCVAVNYLEHVQAKITLTSQRRGDIQLFLKSPAGTKVTLLTQRSHDNSRSGFNQWPFMSVHTWGESPHGNWQLEIHNEGRFMAKITQWDLIFYGTELPAQPNDKQHSIPTWFNMQQVSDNILSQDTTNVSCFQLTADNRCLACTPPAFLYKNRCYDVCPIFTFPFQDKKQNDVNLLISSNMCKNCHISCLKCYGPSNSQCISCLPGHLLRKFNKINESFCYSVTESNASYRDVMLVHSEKKSFLSGLMLIAALLLVVCIMAALVRLTGKPSRNSQRFYGCNIGPLTHYSYDRLSLTSDEEDAKKNNGDCEFVLLTHYTTAEISFKRPNEQQSEKTSFEKKDIQTENRLHV